jgi:mitochondrial fusion and transport protein UGO1
MESLHDSFAPVGAFPSDSPNPLRPYHRDSSISLPFPTSNPSGQSPPRRPGGGSSFSDILPDIDYADYISSDSPSFADMAKRLLDQSIWNYTSVALAHPFEVAKVVLQCYDAGAPKNVDADKSPIERRSPEYVYSDDSESESDAPSYFSPTSPEETPTRRKRRPGYSSRSQSSAHSQSQPQSSTIVLANPDSVLEVIGHIWQNEGVFGVWKGTNSTFVHGILLKTIETWTRGFLSAILNIPDPTLLSSSFGPRALGGPSVLDSSSPFASMSVVVIAAGVAGVLLFPIDIVRTRYVVSCFDKQMLI